MLPRARRRANGSRVRSNVTRQYANARCVRRRSARFERVCRYADCRPRKPSVDSDQKEQFMTQVAEVMTRGVRSLSPSDNLQSAAQAMDELNIGAIPVCENDRVIGVVTDRDITVRGVAQGCAPETTPLSDVMSAHVQTCYEDDSLEDVARKMQGLQVRRIPVLD